MSCIVRGLIAALVLVGSAQSSRATVLIPVITGLTMPIFVGHAGDGNFHVLLLFDDKTEEGIAAAEAFVGRLNARALAMDGTCTGEHGIGQGKMAFLVEELGGTVELMRQVKKALDPDDIFNPGKIFHIA